MDINFRLSFFNFLMWPLKNNLCGHRYLKLQKTKQTKTNKQTNEQPTNQPTKERKKERTNKTKVRKKNFMMRKPRIL